MFFSRRDLLQSARAAPLTLITAIVGAGAPNTLAAEEPANMAALIESRSWTLEPEFAVNLPQPLIIGIRAHRPGETQLSWFADGGYFYFPIGGGSGRYFNAFSLQAGARYSPREGLPYFASAALGYRSLGVTLDMSNYTIDGVAPANQAAVNLYTLHAQLAVGAEWKISRRLALGFDLGVQIPVLGWGGMNLLNTATGENSSNSATLAVDGSTAIGRWARLILPQATLIRLTWLMP